jgi:uncharacterized protein (UPF0262 family)
VGVVLDSQSLAVRSTDLEMERHRVISDLLQENSFALKNAETAGGPYHLRLSLEEDRLVIDIDCATTSHRESVSFALKPLRRQIQDYTIVCDNFYKTAQAGEMHRLEAIDAGRRSIHDEAAEILAEALENKVRLDKTTARRLFSLVYVLHARTVTT